MNAYKVQFLNELNIDPSKLGCLMMKVERVPVRQYLFEIGGEDLYYTSPHPNRHWIKGAGVESHLTLMYGFLQSAHYYRPGIEEVLNGWVPSPESFVIDSIGAFPSTFDDEPYICVVAHLKPTPNLLDAHARLSLLPHIDTFWDYKPHVTLAYVQEDRAGLVIERLQGLRNHMLKPIGLDFGRE